VDFGSTAPSTTSVTQEIDHHNHVLQQYSLNQLRTNEQKTPDDIISISPRSQALKDLQKCTKEMKHNVENSGLTVPFPQLHFAEMWEGGKSVPAASTHHHLKPHSCGVVELGKQNMRADANMEPEAVRFIDPHLALTPASPSPSPMHTYKRSDSMLSNKPVLYNAWTVTESNSATRLMHKYATDT
jgi:hypothetical protein